MIGWPEKEEQLGRGFYFAKKETMQLWCKPTQLLSGYVSVI